MVERGIPAEEIDGGFEWNGWHRGETVIRAAVQRASEDGQPRSLDTYVLDGLLRRTRWTMAFVPPDEAARSAKVLVSIPYWQGQRVVGWQRT